MKFHLFNTYGLHCNIYKARILYLFMLGLGNCVYFPQSNAIYAQVKQPTKEVKGIVVDEKGEPLIGVNVVAKGNSSFGVVTDVNGHFSLSVPTNSTLVISYIGYQNYEIKVGSNPKNLRIQLQPDNKVLDEVVVVAYGSQKKVTVTGSFASVGQKEILSSPSANLASALSGHLPGLTVMQTNGQPGCEDVNLFLRGAATLNGTSPLILVDGVTVDKISNIDPHEVANISVLKDASATAVFGVRGANGVILITTRRGEKGQMKIDASAEYSIQEFAFKPKRTSSSLYARLRNEALENEGAAPYSEFSENDIKLFDSWSTGNPEDPYWHPNQNWQNILFKDFAPMVKSNVNISGGTDRVQYFVSAGYTHQGGIFNVENKSKLGYNPQTNLDRYNFRSNLDYRFNRNIKAYINLSSYVEKVNATNGSLQTIFVGSLTHRPTSAGPLSDTSYPLQIGSDLVSSKADRVVSDPLDPLESAYALLNRSGYHTETRSGLNAITGLEIDLGFITPGLSTKGQISYNPHARSTAYGSRSYIRYKYTKGASGDYNYVLDGGVDDSEGSLNMGRSIASGYVLNLQWQLNYARIFGEKHRVTGLFLAQRDYKEASEDDNIKDKYLPFNILGFSARGTYSFDDRYMFEVNVGYNGSEQFSPSKRFGFFPAFSAGWVASNEKFLKNSPYITYLKFRGSYGKVGNDQIGNARFLYLDDINTNGGTNGNYVLTVPSLGHGGKIEERSLGNPNITWETAAKQNYGIDLKLFNDISVSFDYYIENRKQILIERGIIPAIQGREQSSLPKVNMGEVKNQGYELVLGYNKNIKKDFYIGANINLGYNSNRVLNYDEAMLSEDYAYRYRNTGFALGQNWGYQIDRSVDPEKGKDGSGFFNSNDDITNSGLKYEIGTPRPGDFIYVDQNNDGVINDRDIVPIKYSSLVPKITYGASLSLQWKGIDLSCLVQGVGKFSKYYADAGIFEELSAKSYFDMHLNRWSEDRYQRKLQGEDITITHPRLANTTSTSHVKNDYYIMDASYVRLKNVELGYTLPQKISGFIGAEKIRFYVNGNNLYTWHHLETDSFDPEQTGPTQYPTMRTYNFGVNVTF